MEGYFLNHSRLNEITRACVNSVEDSTRKVLERVSNEDVYQNAVFGPFIRKTQSDAERVLEESRMESLQRLQAMENRQKFATFGICGAIFLGSFALHQSGKKRS